MKFTKFSPISLCQGAQFVLFGSKREYILNGIANILFSIKSNFSTDYSRN